MSEDERAIRERLAALENEVKAEANAQRVRKEAEADKARVAQAAAKARQQAQAKSAASTAKAAVRKAEIEDDLSSLEDLAAPRKKGARGDLAGDVGSALELARRAQGVKAELTRPVKKGEKSWLVSAGLSTMLGPVGWLYAGSWREAVPAAAGWVALAYAVSFLPTMLLLPVLMVALPLSGLAGVMYALGYNRQGARQRLFGEDKAMGKLGLGKKALRPPHEDDG
ncbi:MAG: hypothetical protein IPI49_15090 [Myxococcales bacterium]|nr:hypothetical protein [Myxococcales bacterium]